MHALYWGPFIRVGALMDFQLCNDEAERALRLGVEQKNIHRALTLSISVSEVQCITDWRYSHLSR